MTVRTPNPPVTRADGREGASGPAPSHFSRVRSEVDIRILRCAYQVRPITSRDALTASGLKSRGGVLLWLRRLVADGRLEVVGIRQPPRTGRPNNLYQITEAGHRWLEECDERVRPK